ncbi:hypothetical protein [Vacuolonema iberomarrocanum]|nr:hypothetical protein [filamentous cyanobacterium LEGE 07170]
MLARPTVQDDLYVTADLLADFVGVGTFDRLVRAIDLGEWCLRMNCELV